MTELPVWTPEQAAKLVATVESCDSQIVARAAKDELIASLLANTPMTVPTVVAVMQALSVGT